jgi:hypothetical protein
MKSSKISLHIPEWEKNATLSQMLRVTGGNLLWSDQDRNNDFTQKVLQQVHAEQKYLVCQCGNKHPKLYVAKHGNGCRLSRYPMSGTDHETECFFYDRPVSSSSSHRVGAEEDTVRISYGRTIRDKDAQAREQDDVTQHKPAGNKQTYARQTMLGLYRSLWESAELSQYDPGLRINWSIARAAILKRASEMAWAGQPFDESILMPIPPSEQDSRNDEIRSEHQKMFGLARTRQRAIIIAPVLKWLSPKPEYGKDHAIIDLAIGSAPNAPHQNPYGMHLVRSSGLFNRLRISHPDSFRAIEARMAGKRNETASLSADEKLKVMLTAVCRVSTDMKGGFTLSIDDASLNIISRDFIPCDSSYELQLARSLAIGKRRYQKPLISSEWPDMLPDFELLDVGSDKIPLEVYGLNTEAYLESKRKKIAAYRQSHRPYWHWEAHLSNGKDLWRALRTIPGQCID